MSTDLDTVRLVDRVLVFFARHPEEDLTTADVAVKFSVPQEKVFTSLRNAVNDGRLDRQCTSRSALAVYKAGPKLLQMIGMTMQACAPATGNLQLSVAGGL